MFFPFLGLKQAYYCINFNTYPICIGGESMSNHPPLLLAEIFISENRDEEKISNMINRLQERHITVNTYYPQDSLNKDLKHPRVYISVGESWEQFTALTQLPLYERKKWLHYPSCDEVEPRKLFHCWIHSTDPLPEDKEVPLNRFTSNEPLVSLFTAAYKSGEKIKRPYESLLKQTYTNWEWIIVDDSGDDDETYRSSLSKLKDARVRCYRPDSGSGYIGTIKRSAAGLCTGEILVELDHDDELTPDCLEKIVKAFIDHPDCGFVFGESTEVFWGSNHAHWYGWDFGFGYGSYYRVWIHEMKRWQNIVRTADLNWQTIRHLVGLPNHPRAWTKDCYYLIGAHRPNLLVADDYDLLVRTFLNTKYLRIPHLLYIQYRNEGGDNSTFTRNQQIQIMCQELESYYHERINQRIEELELPSLNGSEYKRIWKTTEDDPKRKTCMITDTDSSRISLIFPIPHTLEPSTHTELLETLQKELENNFKDFEIIVVGNVPNEVESFASLAPSGSIRWWPLEPEDGLEDCINFAKLCTSCTEQKIILPPQITHENKKDFHEVTK